MLILIGYSILFNVGIFWCLDHLNPLQGSEVQCIQFGVV